MDFFKFDLFQNFSIGINKMKKLLLFLFTLSLSSCATTENYEANLNTWLDHNRTINDFISVNGYPDSSYEIPNGHKVYIYSSSHSYIIEGQIFNSSCRTFLETNNKNIIVKWHYKGNHCVANKE